MKPQDEGEISLEYMDEIHDAFNSQDVDAIVEFFAEDGEFLLARGDQPWGTRLKGREVIRAFLTKRFAAFGDMRWEPITRFHCGNRAVSEWVVTVTLDDGRKMKTYGCDLYEFEGKKIVKKDTYWKSMEQSL